MRLPSSAGFSLLLCACLLGCRHQKPGNPWTGEWGHYEQDHSYTYRTFIGEGISIHDCTAPSCTFTIATYSKEANGSAEGTLQLQSPTQAIAHLAAQGQEHCTLQITLDPSRPALHVADRTGDCTYFLTPGGSFVGTYPLHSRDVFVAADVPACFAANAPASLALCTRKLLAEQQSQWEKLFLTVADLTGNSGQSDTLRLQTALDGFMAACNGAPDPGACLQNALSRSTDTLTQRQAAWTQSVTTPGDPDQAAHAAATIAGQYRHRFQNGDVQDRTFTSTDRLDIVILPDHAIEYKLKLNFYNGHECSLEGTARYKQVGFFIDEKKTDMPSLPLCIFEIIPGKDGVRMENPTGGCKMMSCGVRGGYHGAEFKFKERH